MFDVNPAPERHRELKTAISELSGSEASIEVLLEHAPFFDLSEAQAAQSVFAMATTISEQWEPLADSAWHGSKRYTDISASLRTCGHEDRARVGVISKLIKH